MNDWRDIEQASLHCVVLRAAVEMARSGVPQLQALAGAALYLSAQNKRLIDADIERSMRELARPAAREQFWQDLGRPADAHLGAVGGE